MLLGKRPRAPMKRTASAAALPSPEVDVATDHERQQQQQRERVRLAAATEEMWTDATNSPAAPPPPEIASFLKDCGLCRRRLATGRDIFMYRGEIAFCSLECRQNQMYLDDRKEKCSVTSKDAPPVTSPAGSSATAAIFS